MSKQLTIPKPIPKGWKQLSDHCFVDKDGNSHFRIKSTYKITTKNVKNKIEYSEKSRNRALKSERDNPQKNYKKTKKWKKDNPKKYKKYMKNLTDLTAECQRRVLKIRRKKNSLQYMAANKRLVDKRKKLGYSSRCASYKCGECKNIFVKCKCKCHK